MIAKGLTDQKASHRAFAVNSGDARGRDMLARLIVPYLLNTRPCFGIKADAKNQRRCRWRDPQSVDREPKKARIRAGPEITLLIPFQIVGAAGKLNVVSVRELSGGIRGIPRI